MLCFEICQGLVDFRRPAFVPSLKLFLVDLLDTLLDEMSLCEAVLIDSYSFCLHI